MANRFVLGKTNALLMGLSGWPLARMVKTGQDNPMNAISTVLLAFSMSADAFAVAVAKGSALHKPRPSEALRTGLVFGAIEAVTPVIGWGLGSLANNFITAVDHWIAFVILAALGAKMIFESFRPQDATPPATHHTLGALMIAGIGSSIDAMGVGVTLAFVDANIWITAASIGFATFLMATIGIMTGHMIGSRVGKWAEGVGGFVLITIGTKILLEHTGLI